MGKAKGSRFHRLGHRWVIAAIAVGCLLTVFGATSAWTAEPFRLGAAYALTGPASFLGTSELRATQLVVDEVNAAGGVNGHPVELTVEDTKSTETSAVLAIRKLIIQHNVSAILGPSRTGDAMAGISIVSEAGVVMLPPVSGVSVVEPVKERKWIFRPGQGGDLSVGKVLDYAKRAGWKKMGILYSADAYGEDGRDNMRKLAPGMGVTIAREEAFSPTSTNLKPQLTNLKNAGVDAIFMHGVGAPSVVVYRDARELDLKIPIISGHGQANSAFRKAVGDAVVGQPVVGSPILVWKELPDTHPAKAPAREFYKKFMAKYDTPPDMFAGIAYDATRMLLKAFAEAGNSRAGIRDFLENKVKAFPGVTGLYTFSPTDHGGVTSDALVMMIATPDGWRLADYEK